MRILDVSTWTGFPPDNGSSMRIYHLLRGLSRNHEVRHFSQPCWRELRRPGYAAEVKVTPRHLERRHAHPLSVLACEWCRRSWVFQFVLAGAVLQLTRPAVLREWVGWADVVLVEFPWQFAAVARLQPRGPLVLASHNVEVPTRASSAAAAGASMESPWLRYVERVEREAVARADRILVVSPSDLHEYEERYGVEPARMALVLNGGDTERFAPVSAGRRRELRRHLGLLDRPTAVFLSAVPKPPDRVGLAWVRRLAKLIPDMTFLVVGGVLPASEAAGNFIATGSVDEPWLYLQAADISLCPIEHGGGTKIKVCDSLATGLPAVVFPEAVRGTDLRDGEHVLVVEKSERMVEAALRRVVADPDLAGRLGSAGRDFVLAHHDWRSIAQQLEVVLLDLVAEREQRQGRVERPGSRREAMHSDAE